LAKTIAEAAIAKFRGVPRVNNKTRHQINGCSDDSDLDSYQNYGMRTPYHKKFKKQFKSNYHVSKFLIFIYIKLFIDNKRDDNNNEIHHSTKSTQIDFIQSSTKMTTFLK